MQKGKSASNQPQPVAVVPFPTFEVSKRSQDFLTQRAYEQMAKRLEFKPTELVLEQLLEFFEKNNLKISE